MSLITNSDRHILKATHTPLKLSAADNGKLGRALEKATFVRALALQRGEVDAVSAAPSHTGATRVSATSAAILKQFEPQPVAVPDPQPSLLADVPIEELRWFGQALVRHRRSALNAVSQPPPTPGVAPPAGTANSAGLLSSEPTDVGATARAVSIRSTSVSASEAKFAMGNAASALHTAVGALNAFEHAVPNSPIGMLHLERIESAPAGIERGELLATIPLAPQETTTVVQKEWTVTNQEYSSIVSDFLENYSEKGVTEKTELSEATESQSKHSQQLGANASVSGSYGFVTFATSANFSSQLDEQDSQKQSRAHSAEVTQKASARVRKERKVTIQTASTVGKENTSTRTLTNQSATDSIRIDYYSMMRKWRLRLLQYGLRMTYDIAIPEPGATLRQQHAKLAALDAELAAPFKFGIKASDIDAFDANSKTYYAKLAADIGASVEVPKVSKPQPMIVTSEIKGTESAGWPSGDFPINIDEGYSVDSATATLLFYCQPGNEGERFFLLFGEGYLLWANTLQSTWSVEIHTHTDISWVFSTTFDKDHQGPFYGQKGLQQVHYTSGRIRAGSISVTLNLSLSDEWLAAWRQRVWDTLFNAARDKFYSSLQAKTQERDALRAQLEGVDTLTLRREELEEIMKGVLRWLLGPSFQFMPKDVIDSITASVKAAHARDAPPLNDEDIATMVADGEAFSGNILGLGTGAWSTMMAYQEMVKFLHQAIEWENLLYLVYPYFWDNPVAWDFIRTLQHPDSAREQFLRAGSARVVLTVRPGFESDFAAFVDRGDLSVVLDGTHPYLSIGNELRARANANYPGIPPANPEPNPRPLVTFLQRKAWSDMQTIIKALDAYNDKNGTYPTTDEGLGALTPTVPTTDPWGNPYVYNSPGMYKDFELSSRGADGKPGGDGENADITSWSEASLIAEWYDYTPTHGIDIQVTTALTQMA